MKTIRKMRLYKFIRVLYSQPHFLFSPPSSIVILVSSQGRTPAPSAPPSADGAFFGDEDGIASLQEDTGKFYPPVYPPASRSEQRQHQGQLQRLLSLSESLEHDGGIAGPRDRCAVRFEFQCTAGGDVAFVGPGIGYPDNFASREYRYYGNRGHGIGALLEVAHGNDAVAVLLNRSN
jgi:hypothetical protein